MGGLGRMGAERGAQRKRPKLKKGLPRGAHIPLILDLASAVPPSSRDAPAGRPYRPGGGVSEATWTRPRPFRNFNGSISYRIGFEFESLEYLPSEAGAHLS